VFLVFEATDHSELEDEAQLVSLQVQHRNLPPWVIGSPSGKSRSKSGLLISRQPGCAVRPCAGCDL